MKLNFFSSKTKIYNQLMSHGNKSINEKFLLKNFKFLQKENKKNHLYLLKLAIINSAPIVRTRRLRKKNRKSIKEFPYVLTRKNRIALAMQYTLTRTHKKPLFQKISDFAQKRSDSLKEKKLEQKLSLVKKKYLFFRWFF